MYCGFPRVKVLFVTQNSKTFSSMKNVPKCLKHFNATKSAIINLINENKGMIKENCSFFIYSYCSICICCLFLNCDALCSACFEPMAQNEFSKQLRSNVHYEVGNDLKYLLHCSQDKKTKAHFSRRPDACSCVCICLNVCCYIYLRFVLCMCDWVFVYEWWMCGCVCVGACFPYYFRIAVSCAVLQYICILKITKSWMFIVIPYIW